MSKTLLQKLREEQDLSQEALAIMASVGRRTVQRLEAGEGGHLDTYIALARALGVKPGKLLADRLKRPVKVRDE